MSRRAEVRQLRDPRGMPVADHLVGLLPSPLMPLVVRLDERLLFHQCTGRIVDTPPRRLDSFESAIAPFFDASLPFGQGVEDDGNNSDGGYINILQP